MKVRTKFVELLFGSGRRSGDLVAPGDADCRWRMAATLGRAAGNDEAALPADAAPRPEEADVRANRCDGGR